MEYARLVGALVFGLACVLITATVLVADVKASEYGVWVKQFLPGPVRTEVLVLLSVMAASGLALVYERNVQLSLAVAVASATASVVVSYQNLDPVIPPTL